MRKELTERETWFKSKKEDDESPKKIRRLNRGRKPQRNVKKESKGNKDGKEMDITSVLFIPHTVNSELAKKIREKGIDIWITFVY